MVSLEDRFCQLLREHGRIVLKVASTYAWEYEDRRDLVQEIHARLWKAFPSYDESRPFATWIYRIALNVAVSHIRTERTRKQNTVPLDQVLAEDLANPPIPHGLDSQLDFLHRFTDCLGPLDKALLILYMEGQSYLQISEILGISESNVATKISRLKQLARQEGAKEQ